MTNKPHKAKSEHINESHQIQNNCPIGLISFKRNTMANDADLFGDSSDDADTDDLLAAAKSQPIAKKKGRDRATKKAAAKKDIPGEFVWGWPILVV
jgi:hypothetical protein